MKKMITMVPCLLLIMVSLSTLAKVTAEPKDKSEIKDALPGNINETDTAYPALKSYSNSVAIKIMREFMKDYKNPSNVIWHKCRWGYTVNFTIDSIENIAAYKNTGTCLYTIRKYSEKKMSPSLRHIIKTSYYDYKILLIDEVNIYDQENTIYVVLLQYANHTKQVRVCGGEIQEIVDFYNQ